jgi:Spy/CpxP family protein refolding chaperone
MKTTFTTPRKTLMMALTALVMGSATLAGSASAADTTPAAATATKPAAQHDRHERMQHRMAKHVAHLHDSLKLTAAQEPAWQSFIASAKPAKPADGQRPDRAAFKNMSAPERMAKGIEHSKQHIAMQESRLESLKTFYAVLTPEQRTVFDKQAGHGRPMHRGWRGGRGGPDGQHGRDAKDAGQVG